MKVSISKRVIVLIAIFGSLIGRAQKPLSELASLDLHVIPYPQKVQLREGDFILGNTLSIGLDGKTSAVDQRTAEHLANGFKKEWGVNALVKDKAQNCPLKLVKVKKLASGKEQGYELEVTETGVRILAQDDDGLFYGVQTLLQLVKAYKDGFKIPGMYLEDWPDVAVRAIHYDTKHHQDRASYVKALIRDLAKFKINMLVWEWEDKLAYESYPQIGAPGAFTKQEMQEFTAYARDYHIELTPLVQGLGHVSFILKWPEFKHLREVADSDWEFNPLKDETYELLFKLWDEAIEATPGSKYIHIGSDETFELGLCDECREKAKEIGNSGLYHLFAKRAAKYLKKKRKIMIWERPMGWTKSRSPIKNMKPDPDLVLTEEYHYETPDFKYAQQAHDLGYELFMYDPNPGLEPLFLPYYFKMSSNRITDTPRKMEGSLKASYDLLTASANTGLFHGMINTSWDDSGLHNQMWMFGFAASAQYSWNANAPGLEEFENSFFINYYGPEVRDMKELYLLLNEGAYFYAHSLERNLWHHGDIGKTHLPDLPRGQYIEYDPYWKHEYAPQLKKAKQELKRINRAMQIIDMNKRLADRNTYDFDVYRSIAELIAHTCQLYIDMENLESTITRAHKNAFSDREASLTALHDAETLVQEMLDRRNRVFGQLTTVWEKTRLPKGMSSADKKYFHKMDRSRHFANRRPGLDFLIYDEELLDLEGYLEKLKTYTNNFQLKF
ncbi:MULTISPECIES: beta-N-acetylhexosaminidase [Flavobacteriaceae]|uniref:beta-N-acetylhexosaminidase n=1 Tax=Flavobacteriaceae TaxID=49546 RepID=UPI001492BBD4|nr:MULTISPECIES: beta-N-acetylhexosaminidase [Allomuricauda]MDC6366819.1 beta-N-acetylhexosaminidase [Muricauda sp. AC10]